ncbi:hypothetical protein ACFPQ7_19095 [Methylobacterium iners]|uniref:hypothetical protein n=1 Tax=Methylobacterium iners TaxID=418707 RepID=UPI00361BED30
MSGEPDHSDEGSVETISAVSSRMRSAPSAALIAPASTSSPNVVPLFVELEALDPDADLQDPDWPGALQLIRDVGAQVRRERDRAEEIVQQAHSLIQRTVQQAEWAERRAEMAEAKACEANLRADRAEMSLRLTEERLQQAEELARAAQAREREAQQWLRRLYASLKHEQQQLTRGTL